MFITISLMKLFVFEVIRKVYFSLPRYNRTERHFPEGVVNAMKRSGGPYSPCGTMVRHLKYLSRKIIPQSSLHPFGIKTTHILSHHTFHNIHNEEVLN